MVARPDWPIAAGYFAYFAAVGVFQPFFPVHLAALGLSALDIGFVLALWSGARIASPLALAWLADRREDRRPLLRYLALGGALAGACLVAASTLGTIALGVAALSLCHNGLMPVFDAHVLEWLGAKAARYGRLRLYGSLGFILTAVGLGFLTSRDGPGAIRFALAACLALAALAVLLLPPASHAAQGTVGWAEFGRALRRRPLLALLAVSFLHLAGFGGYYGFYSLYLARAGYGPGTIGLFWAAGVAAEIALFVVVPRLIVRYPLPRLLEVALAATLLRWLLVATVPGVPALMLAAQLLHFAGFGLFHAVVVLLGPSLMPPGSGARAQALVTSIGWGAGGMVGSLLAGEMWEKLGPRAVFLGSAALAAMAWLVAAQGLRLALPSRPPAGAAGG